MYFIPRNNKIYHYIAHMNIKNRYLCTGFLLCIFLIVSYFTQRLITIYNDIYAQELVALRNQSQDCIRLEEKNKKFTLDRTMIKQEIQQHRSNASHEYFKKQLLAILEIVKKTGLKLNSYGVQKEKNYEWYAKETTHFDVTGSFEQIMHFFEHIKNSQTMTSVSQWTITRLDNDLFHVSCDIDFIVVLEA